MKSEWSQRLQALIDAALGTRARQRPADGGQLSLNLDGGAPEPDGPVYHDEPIVFTAAQMAEYTPPEIRRMRRAAQNFDGYSQSTAMLFFTQGKMMESFEDDYPGHADYFQYSPTYQAMTNQQLRVYFTWRSRVRSGWIEQTALSYVYVYVYELLGGIGVSSPQEGYDTLLRFWQAYRDLDSRLDEHLPGWLRDYAVWHGLDPAQLPGGGLSRQDQAVLTLLHRREHTDGEICAALSLLSSYSLENSRFYKLHPQETAQLVSRVYAALEEYYGKHRKNDLCAKLFGRSYSSPYQMFHGAVFYQDGPHPDTVYELTPLHRFRCESGRWTQEHFYFYRQKSAEAGALLKQIDYQLRQAWGFRSPLKPAELSKTFQSVLDRVLEQWLAERAAAQEAAARAAAPRLTIDTSRLQQIRRAALETQQRLIVDEPEDEAPPAFTAAKAAESAPAADSAPAAPDASAAPAFAAPDPAPAAPDGAAAAPEETPALRPEEYRLLQCLLYDRPWQDWARAAGLTPALLADRINEALFDRFADTVLSCDGDVPTLIEDYIDDLKGLIHP